MFIKKTLCRFNFLTVLLTKNLIINQKSIKQKVRALKMCYFKLEIFCGFILIEFLVFMLKWYNNNIITVGIILYYY